LDNPNKKINLQKIKIIDEVKVNIEQHNEDLKVVLTNKKKISDKIALWGSIFSLIISALTIWYTSHAHQEDIENWKDLNLARISVIDPKFFTFRSLTFEDLLKQDSGYTLHGIQNPSEANDNPNFVLIKNLVVAYDTLTKSYIDNTSAITLTQLKNELKIKGKYSDTALIYKQYYKPQITIQNVGQTSCIIDSIIIKDVFFDTSNVRIDVSKFQYIPLEQKNFTLDPGKTFMSARFDFHYPLNATVPFFKYTFEVYYTPIKHKQVPKIVVVSYVKGEFIVRDTTAAL
jgi:hypothetical protein